MNVTAAEEAVSNLLPIAVSVIIMLGALEGVLLFKKKRKGEEGEEQPELDPLDAQIQEIYKLQKKHKKDQEV